MDVISDVMSTIRFTGNVFLHANFAGEWGAHYQAIDVPVFHYLVHGTVWLATEGQRKFTKLEAGDVAFFPSGVGHYIASSPESERTKMTIVPGETCMHTDIPDTEAEQQLLCGIFQTKDDFQHPLFTSLPELMHVKFSSMNDSELPHRHVAHLIHCAIDTGYAGTDILIDRLYEILFIQLMQQYFSDKKSVDSFYNAPSMTRVGEVLKEIHANPASNWTLDNMAESAYMSRTSFTTNFRKCVGMSPMAYLTMWRMNKARSLVRNSGFPLRSIAKKVGYRTQTGFNKAFKQHFGFSPKSLRK